MTVTSTTIKTTPYACDGATVDFAFSWEVWETSEVKVILRLASDGTETTLTEGTGASSYAVTLSSDMPSAGYITTVTTYSALYEIVIKANFPETQEVDYGEGDKFPSASSEEALDRGVRLTQQLGEQLSRAILFPESTTLEDIELPEISAARADYYLKINNAGSAIEWADLVAYGDLNSHDNGASGAVHDNLVTDMVEDFTANSNSVIPGFSLNATAAEVATGNEQTKTVTPASLAAVWQYETIQVPAGSLRPAQTNAGTQDIQEYPGNEVQRDYVEMEDYNDESVGYDITLWLPDTWDQATLKVMASWMASYSEALNLGASIELGYQIRAYNAGSPIDTNWSTPPVYVTDAVTNEASDTEGETIASANIASSVPGSTNRLDVRVTRRSIANNASAPIWLTQLLFQFKKTNQASGW
ncbi:MAG: hypothetical protein KJ556_21485 [Gammaproteobacteria bacterium]|nr:hypothetical protein [Gammaproteobacteria bacterium]